MPGKLYIILPVYNEGQSIYHLLEAYSRLLPSLGLPHQILVIDDHSQDDSPAWIARAASEFSGLNLHTLRHPVNQGLHGVLNTGLGLLEGLGPDDLLLTMDGDNTHNPFLLKEMLPKIEQGADIVIASRYCEASRISGLTRARVILSYRGGAALPPALAHPRRQGLHLPLPPLSWRGPLAPAAEPRAGLPAPARLHLRQRAPCAGWPSPAWSAWRRP